MGIHDGAEYEAIVFISYDNMSERYVVHWIDIFGGRFSETLGYGNSRDQHSIRFVFEYATGPFTTRSRVTRKMGHGRSRSSRKSEREMDRFRKRNSPENKVRDHKNYLPKK